MHARPRPDQAEEPWHDVDGHVSIAQRADDVHRLGIGLVRERDDDTVDAVLCNEMLEVLQPAEHGDVSGLGALLERRRVDEADQVEAVLGMLADLAGDELADRSGAEDDGAHGV